MNYLPGEFWVSLPSERELNEMARKAVSYDRLTRLRPLRWVYTMRDAVWVTP